MQAMVLEKPGSALNLYDYPVPQPDLHELLIKVDACGVCRTDLHILDGELSSPKLPLVLGHEIVGKVTATGGEAQGFAVGDLVGVPWLASTCQQCRWCLAGKENLCDKAIFTGYGCNGGYAQYTLAYASYCFPVPECYLPANAAPLLCAGLIGFRSLKMAGDGQRLGLYGFGAAAHIIIQIACAQGREVFAFTRPGDSTGQSFARQLGASWAGGSDQSPPAELDSSIIFAPVGQLVPAALKATVKGGAVVCAGIHMSDIPSFPYELLWGERKVCSVANLTRADGQEFFKLAPTVPVHTTVQTYRLDEANRALADLREGRVVGAPVLVLT